MIRKNNMTIKKKYLLKFILTIILLSLFIFKINTAEVFKSLGEISFTVILSVILIDVAANFLSAYKWHLLIPLHSYLQILFVGMLGRFYSFVLPGQLVGEAVKAYQLGTKKNSGEQIAASVVIDKVTGIIGVFIIGIMGLLMSAKSIPAEFLTSLITGMTLAVLFLFSLRLNYFKKLLSKILKFIAEKISRIKPFIEKINNMLEIWEAYLLRPVFIFYNIILGCLYQLTGVAMIFLLSRSLNISLNATDYCWIFAVVSIALLLPVTIAGLGVREGAFIGIMAMLGVSNEKALALSFAFLAVQIFDALIGGIVELTKVYKKF